jgi:glycosyltransferase involved in cell wall biosynthesis
VVEDAKQGAELRVGVNALLLNQGAGYRQTGVSRYIDRLLRALPEAMDSDELRVYAGRGVEAPTGDKSGSWRNLPIPTSRPEIRILSEHLALPAFARRDHLDLVHGTVNVVPPGLPCPAVVTVHDLAFLRFPDQVTKKRFHYLSRMIRGSVKRATRVLAVSEGTKRDIVELLDVAPEKIAVIPLGVDERFRPLDKEALKTFRQQAGIEGPLALFVGTLEPRKNLPRLVEAFSMIADDVPHDLVVIGPEGWLTSEIHETSTRLLERGRLQFRGFVPDGQLPAWYSVCDLFAYPSLYEGFGLPVLEAMACGAPVLTSCVSALPEVVGDAALTVSPTDTQAIADEMKRLLTDSELRRDLQRRGIERSKAFTWARTAELTVEVYREAAGR